MVPRLAIALMIVLAGCTAVNDTGSPEPTTTPVQTTSATPTPVTPDDATESNTIEYSELSAEEKEAFEAAVNGGARFFDRHIDGKVFDPDTQRPFIEHEYVLRNDTYYRLSYNSGVRYSSYLIGAEEGQPSEGDTVVAFEELPEETKEPVRSAIQHGSYSTSLSRSGSMPPGLSGVEYVEYSGTYYSISTGVSDAWVQVWEAERVE